ncbi:MAG: molybdopterin-guanine dinucleotide biosynthesis protein B [Candidatus Competibacteraceae bacterium]|nr:molybdopterin-guanine dinucleotide biosynthesis protein B [Candidatus Competibacteraceae bacterium]
MKVLGITGWSGSGKTTLIVALIPRLRALGLTVSTLKHAHHDVDLDRPGKDTFRHREAGANEVILATGRRWVLLHELRDEAEPAVADLLTYLQPVDLVLVEGWKTGHYPKLEIWRSTATDKPPQFLNDPMVIAVASDPMLDPAHYGRPDLPVLSVADLAGITTFILRFTRAL